MKASYFLLIAALMTLCGCRPHEMQLDIETPQQLFDQGFPSDLWRDAQGQVNLSRFPLPQHPFTRDYSNAVRELGLGYSPMMPVYLRFTGNPTPEALQLFGAPLDYADTRSGIQLLDIDPDSPQRGKRFPLQVSLNSLTTLYKPQGLLQVIPQGAPLNENTTYALIVTRAALSDISQWQQAHNLRLMLHEAMPAQTALQKAHQSYQPLRAQLKSEGISSDEIMAATVWTTGEPSRYFRELGEALERVAPPDPASPFKLSKETDDFCVLSTEWDVPQFQQGYFPYPFTPAGGKVQRDTEGNLLIQRLRRTPVHIALPKQDMPASGFPLLIYNHGTAGKSSQFFERGYTQADGTSTDHGNIAEVAARRGWATSGMGGHFGADHQQSELFWNTLLGALPGFSLNYLEYNPLNPVAMRDNLFQSIAERILFRRLLNHMQWDASLCPGVKTQGTPVFFNPDLQVVMGQSLGSMTSVGQAALDNHAYQGLIPTGAGTYGFHLSIFYGGLKMLGERRVGDVIIPAYLQIPGATLMEDPFHPVWALAEMALAPANMAHALHHWQQGSTQTPPHVLVVEGHVDPEVTLEAQRPLLRALEADLIGDELSVAEAEQLLPTLQWAGRSQLMPPVAGNASDGRTVGVVRYAEDGIKSGHHVVFQYAQAKHQIGCFLETLAVRGQPVIVKGAALHGPCD